MSYAAASLEPMTDVQQKAQNPARTATSPYIAMQQLKVANPIDPYAPIRAQITKPVKLLENVFGRDLRTDPKDRDLKVEASLKPQQFGRDQMNLGSLPYATSPRLKRIPLDRIVPADTRIPQGEWNEALARSGPFCDRSFQIWDYAPFLPSRGDVALDPRYSGNRMRQFTRSYRTRGV